MSNIEISIRNAETTETDKFGNIPDNLPVPFQQIRKLIKRFEVCHFKYQQHLGSIKKTVFNVKTNTDLYKTGSKPIEKVENTWRKDKTGRSLLGQQYLWALINWLAYYPKAEFQIDQTLFV